MKLSLSYSHQLGIGTHESDKAGRGTSYSYNVENVFRVRCLDIDTCSITELFTDVSDKLSEWACENPRALNEIHLDRAKYEAQNAKTNFDRINTMLRRACEAIGIRCDSRSSERPNSRPDGLTIQTTMLLNEDSLASLCERSSGQLRKWLLQVITNLSSMPGRTTGDAGSKAARVRKGMQIHVEEFCEECQRLRRPCNLRMEVSKSTAHPEDVVIKGLPLDITEERLMEIFQRYGQILRTYILPANPQFLGRMAFITFAKPRAAFEKFNSE